MKFWYTNAQGHSKWANIKHKKARNDAQKHKLYHKFSREVMIAAATGSDPESNFALDAVLRRAHKASVPKHVLEKAIAIGSGEGKHDGAKFENVVYEGSGPGGSLFMVEAVTDNRKRTAPNVRHYFSKFGGQLEANTANFAFQRVGYFTINVANMEAAEAAAEAAIESGAMDVIMPEESDFEKPKDDAAAAEEEEHEPVVEVVCEMTDFESTVKAITSAGLEAHNAELIYDPRIPISIDNEDTFASFEKLVETLENDDDISKVFHNVRQSS